MAKRLFSFILSLLMVLSIVPLSVLAEETESTVTENIGTQSEETTATEEESSSEDILWEYESYGDGIALTKYLGTQADVYVPNKLEVNGTEYTVIKLAEGIFENNDNVNSVTLASGILEIGDRAFYDCDSLVCILLSEELTTIGAEAFYSCDSFNSVILYSCIKSIGEKAFFECSKLVVYCYTDSFAYAYASQNEISFKLLDNTEAPEVVTYDRFLYHISNGEATLMGPAGDSFSYHSSVISIPAYVNGVPVTKVSSFAFSGKWLQVDNGDFYSYIWQLILPDTVKFIGESAFSSTSLSRVKLPQNLTEINDGVFSYNTHLCEIEIGSNVNKIGDSAFESTGLYELPNLENVKQIGYRAFANTNLTEIVYPIGIEMDSAVFADCALLEEVYIEYFDGMLPYDMFDNCTKLARVYLAEAQSFDEQSFYLCHFYDCTNYYYDYDIPYWCVSDIYEEAPIVEYSGVNYFISDFEAILMYCNNTDAYVEIPEYVDGYPVTRINSYAFSNNTSVYGITLPSTIREIGEGAFSGCDFLSNINIPEGVEELPSYVFEGCYYLHEIEIPESLTRICSYAFRRSGLAYLPDLKNVTAVEWGAFEECIQMTEATVSPNIQWEESVFCDCDSLTTVVFQDGITYMPLNMFYSCDSLEIVIIPQSVSNMDERCITGKNLVLGVYGDSCAMQYAIDNNIPYYDVETEPEIEVVELDEVKYFIINGEAQVASSTARFNLAIPSSVNGYPVTVIRPHAFVGNYFYDVSLPDTLREIGRGAFSRTYLKSINLPEGLEKIGEYAFQVTEIQQIELPSSLKYLGSGAFAHTKILNLPKLPELEYIGNYVFSGTRISGTFVIGNEIDYGYGCVSGCSRIKKIIIESGVTSIGSGEFENCKGLETIIIPSSVTTISKTSFSGCGKVILHVFEGSYAHQFAIENNMEYFILKYEENPEIAYGVAIEGVVNNSDGTVASGVTVEIYHEDGTLKESVVTDENGAYAFTYAEVGKYTIKAYNEAGNSASTSVSVKRMNVFDVFLMGDTSITLKNSFNVSGTVSDSSAAVKITDLEGNVIAALDTTNGAFAFAEIANGTYLVTAESENGFASKEITVYNNDVTDISHVITTDVASIWGYVEVEDRQLGKHRRHWVTVSVYNEEGNVIATQKSDKDGKYTFANLPLGDYSVVATVSEMRPDKKHGYDRSHDLYGYAYVSLTESGTFEVDTIVLYEDNDYTASVSGKVNINKDKSNTCEIVMYNAFGIEYAKVDSENGRYSFKNVKDGLYIITAITENDGMGYTVITVRNGKVHGNTNINIVKSDKIKDREDKFGEDVPDFENDSEIEGYRARIADEKRFYDSLSQKEKKQLSKEYVRRLNQYIEWLSKCDYTSSDSTKVENGGLVVSGDELENGDEISFTITVEKQEMWEENTNGVETAQDYIHHSINDKAGNSEIVQYYEISMTKTSNGSDKAITSVYKDTDAMGKFRITLEIPEEYRGYKHYSLVHVHCGEVVTLTDLDNDPNTITIEVDKFSTFALATTNEELVDEAESTVTIDDIITFKGYSVGPDGTSMCAGFDIDRESLELYEQKTGKTIDFGVVFTSYDLLGGKAPLVSETGEAITDTTVIKSSLKDYAYSTYELVLTDITEEYANHKFVVSAYLYDGEGVSYIQGKETSESVIGHSLNEVKEVIQ